MPSGQPPALDLFEAAPFPSGLGAASPQGAAMTAAPQRNGTVNGLYATVDRSGASENAAVPGRNVMYITLLFHVML